MPSHRSSDLNFSRTVISIPNLLHFPLESECHHHFHSPSAPFSHTAFKVSVVANYQQMLQLKERGALRDPSLHYNVGLSLILKWHRKRHTLEKAAKMEHRCQRTGQHRERLIGTTRGPRFPDMEGRLYDEFCFMRKQGLRITERFVCVHARQLGGEDVRGSHGWFQNFLQQRGITMRKPFNRAPKAQSNRLQTAHLWYTNLGRRLQPDDPHAPHCSKWGKWAL